MFGDGETGSHQLLRERQESTGTRSAGLLDADGYIPMRKKICWLVTVEILLPVLGFVSRRITSESNVVLVDFQNSDFYVIADDEGFIRSTGDNPHERSLLESNQEKRRPKKPRERMGSFWRIAKNMRRIGNEESGRRQDGDPGESDSIDHKIREIDGPA